MKTTHSIRLFAAVLAGACLIAAPRAEASSTNINVDADEFALSCTWDPDFDCAPGSFSFTATATCEDKTPDPVQPVSISAGYTLPGGATAGATNSGVNEVTLNLSGVGPGPVAVAFSGADESFSATVHALKVDIEQEREDFCIHAGEQTLDLTADSYLGPTESTAYWYWDATYVHSGLSYSFTETNPCSVTVRAEAVKLPTCCDTCMVNIVEVDLDVEGVDDPVEENSPGALLCVTNAPGQTVTRKRITINKCAPASWDGHVTLLWSAGNVKVYAASTGGDEVTSGTTFANAALPKDLWVEGTAPSAAAGDVVFRLNPVEATCPNAATGCDRVVMTVVKVDLVKADSQAYTTPDIFPNICRNAQTSYKKAKWKAVVKPVGTKAKVYQILPAFGGHVFVELTAIDTADLENIEDEDEFWVGDCGQSGPFELEIVHQDLRSCYVDKAGSVFAFEFSIARDTDLDSGSTHPAGGTSASFAGATATVEHLNDLTGTTNIGARANAGYQLSVVSDSFTGAGLTVRARALTRLTSSGSLMIRNYPLGLPSFNIGLSYSWGLVSLSVGSSIGWPKRGSSAGGAGIQLDINGSISGQPQDSRSCLDVMYTDTVTVEKTFSLSLGVDFADAHRLYTAGVTEYPVQTRTDVLSSVKTGTYGVDTCVPLNTHTTDAPTILGEDDNVFEIQ